MYAFGVVLLELITGRRALDTNLPKGKQFLVEWVRPLLSLARDDGQTVPIDRFLDPRLERNRAHFFTKELRAMVHAASLCLRREPQARPSMSKVDSLRTAPLDHQILYKESKASFHQIKLLMIFRSCGF